MLRYGQDYVHVGDKAYELRFQARRLVGIKEAAKALGYTPTKEPTPAIPGPEGLLDEN